MQFEQTPEHTEFEINTPNKYFFGLLTILVTLPMVLGLLLILLMSFTGDSNLIVAVAVVLFVSAMCLSFGTITLKKATNNLILNDSKLIITYYNSTLGIS